MSNKRNADQFVSDLTEQVAMWADESLFGHGLSDEDYEAAVEKFTEDCGWTIQQTLMERPDR